MEFIFKLTNWSIAIFYAVLVPTAIAFAATMYTGDIAASAVLGVIVSLLVLIAIIIAHCCYRAKREQTLAAEQFERVAAITEKRMADCNAPAEDIRAMSGLVDALLRGRDTKK